MSKKQFPTSEDIVKDPVGWFDERLPIVSFVKNHVAGKKTPKNLNWAWNFGSLAGIALVIQILTGVFLAMHYKPDVHLAFDSIQYIIRDVQGGWIIRNLHMVGASFFFMVVYAHIARGLYYGSYKAPREVLWWFGIFVFFLMMAIAFMGYVLPWGQMSFWGATVITNLLSVIPFVGKDIVVWLWGGFSVGDPTLVRFFALHFVLPFVLLGVVFLHLWALWTSKSSNPEGIELKREKDWIPFHPYYTIKDSVGFGVYLIPYCLMVFFLPDALGHTDNYIPANPMVTPAHIVPEWYFLPFYAILRAIPSKELGVLAMFGSIAILFLLPFLDRSPVRSAKYRPVYKQVFYIFIITVMTLGWVGGKPPEGIYVTISRVATALYFAFFLSLPLIAKFEKVPAIPATLDDVKPKKRRSIFFS